MKPDCAPVGRPEAIGQKKSDPDPFFLFTDFSPQFTCRHARHIHKAKISDNKK
jgi:hypothetical protein